VVLTADDCRPISHVDAPHPVRPFPAPTRPETGDESAVPAGCCFLLDEPAEAKRDEGGGVVRAGLALRHERDPGRLAAAVRALDERLSGPLGLGACWSSARRATS